MQGVKGTTRMVGVFGQPVGHSLSPIVHNAAFEFLGLDLVYAAFDVSPDGLGRAVEAITALSMVGANVTIPHKVRVMDLMDDTDENALYLGNVNTIVNRQGYLTGHNTDGPGITAALADAGVDVPGRRVLCLGAGGVARTSALQMAKEGAAQIVIAARSPERGAGLADFVRARAPKGCLVSYVPSGDLERDAASGRYEGSLVAAVDGADLIIQTTQVGMHPRYEVPSPCPPEALGPGKTVFELIYRPLETSLVREARRRGCTVVHGSALFLHQAALSFELWTGVPAPRAAMARVLHEALGRDE